MGVTPAHRFIDGRPDTFRIAKHLVIPESDDAIALGLDQFRALFIPLRPMLSAVDLDYELGAMTGEVGGEHPKRHL